MWQCKRIQVLFWFGNCHMLNWNKVPSPSAQGEKKKKYKAARTVTVTKAAMDPPIMHLSLMAMKKRYVLILGYS